MPIFRIVYIDSDCIDDVSTGLRTLTAEFQNRELAEAAMAKHGHRIAHLAQMGRAETCRDPVAVPIASGFTASPRHRDEPRASATYPIFGLPRYDLAAMAVIVAGAAMTGAAIWLF